MFKLEITSPESTKRAIESAENIAANTHFGVEKGLWKSGKDLLGEFRRQVLAKDKTGKIYFRRDKAGRRRRHVASGPGQTPANITGAYRKGASFSVRSGNELAFGNDDPKSYYLELGTTRMRKRPGLKNAIRATERDLIRNLSTEILEAI